MAFHSPPVPSSLDGDEFVLRPLTVDHVHVDYAAVMESPAMLRRWSGTSWPSDDFSVEENRRDLELHQREHLQGVAFTHTVLAGDECVGCVYITPLETVSEANPGVLGSVREDAAVVRFWVRQSRLVDGLDGRLLASLRTWFSEAWSFSSVHFATAEADGRQVALFEAAGLEPVFAVTLPGRDGTFLLYHP